MLFTSCEVADYKILAERWQKIFGKKGPNSFQFERNLKKDQLNSDGFFLSCLPEGVLSLT